jgi:hypothetical protein
VFPFLEKITRLYNASHHAVFWHTHRAARKKKKYGLKAQRRKFLAKQFFCIDLGTKA